MCFYVFNIKQSVSSICVQWWTKSWVQTDKNMIYMNIFTFEFHKLNTHHLKYNVRPWWNSRAVASRRAWQANTRFSLVWLPDLCMKEETFYLAFYGIFFFRSCQPRWQCYGFICLKVCMTRVYIFLLLTKHSATVGDVKFLVIPTS